MEISPRQQMRIAQVVSGDGTQVRFVAEGPLRGALRVLTPIVTRMIDRQFREYHANLRRNVESLP